MHVKFVKNTFNQREALPKKLVKGNKTFKLKPIDVKQESNNFKRKNNTKEREKKKQTNPVHIQTGRSKPLISNHSKSIKKPGGVQSENSSHFQNNLLAECRQLGLDTNRISEQN